MDWAEVNKELRKPLNSKHVFERKQGGRDVSYIEAWRAIDEANRIFGFNGWSSETEFQLVSEKPRKIGQQQKEGWGVSYIAKVRVMVDGIPREGVGAGHGIDVDLGQAHESAIKEAESDARKRALMTFGNPFGLALYDKTQANVSDDPPEPVRQSAAAPKAQEPSDAYLELRATLDTIEDGKHLSMWASGVKSAVETKKITMSERLILSNLYEKKKADLERVPA